MKKVWILLLLITVLAGVLRFWQLGKIPSSPDWDEVALGYNAYSIIHTAHDEYGKFLPIVFRSFDDYKPGLYVYLAIPSIWLFGLSVFATRFPSALLGVITVFATFFLVKELTKSNKLGLLASILLAISPWHIQFSRVAFEANTGVAFNLLAVLFFIKGLKKPVYLFASVLCIVAGIYVYQSEKVFAPLLFISLIVIFYKQLFMISKKYLVTGVVIGVILILPLLSYIATDKQALSRAKGVSVFSDTTSTLKLNAQRLLYDQQHNDKLGLLFDNRRLVFAKEVFANYISHWDFNWLFITGDISRHHAPNMGLLYLWELPFLLIGMYMLVFGNFDKKTKTLLIVWFLLTPIPASITTGVPHAVRTINFLPLFQIIVAVGLLQSYMFIVSKITYSRARCGILTIIGLCVIFNIGYYFNQYFVQQDYYNAVDWQYGYQQAISETKLLLPRYKKVIVSNQPFMDQSYMFFLFYLQYSPKDYQNSSLMTSGGFKETHEFGKFQFRPIDWNKEEKSNAILYIGRATDFNPSAKILKTIFFPDGKPAMLIVEG